MPHPEVFVGLHIPRCAGSSLLERVHAALPGEAIYQNTDMVRNWQEGRLEFLARDRRRLRFVWGHFLSEEMLKLLPGSPVLVVGLREPHARMLSEIRHQQRVLGLQGHDEASVRAGIVDLLRSRWNPICMQLVDSFPTLAGSGFPFRPGTGDHIVERAWRVLQHCEFVYDVDNFEAVATALFARLGSPQRRIDTNASDRTPDELDHRQWHQLAGIDDSFMALDLELYRRAQQRCYRRVVQRIAPRRRAALRNLQQAPVDLPALRKHMLDGAAAQYDSWRLLDEVVAHRQRLIDELRAEIGRATPAGAAVADDLPPDRVSPTRQQLLRELEAEVEHHRAWRRDRAASGAADPR